MSCNTPITRGVFDSTTLQTVAANGTINFPDVTSTGTCNTAASGVFTLRRAGTYIVHVNVTVTPTAAGVQEIQLIRNGSPVPGAHALETVAAAGDSASMAFTALVSVTNNASTTLFVRSVPATSIRVANITIEPVNY